MFTLNNDSRVTGNPEQARQLILTAWIANQDGGFASLARCSSFLKPFWNTLNVNLLNRLGSRGCLSLGDIIIGILKEGMDLVNYVIILGKTFL